MQTIYIAERDIERFVHNYLNSVIQNVFSCIFYYLNKTCNMTTLSQTVWTGDWVPKGPSLQASIYTLFPKTRHDNDMNISIKRSNDHIIKFLKKSSIASFYFYCWIAQL